MSAKWTTADDRRYEQWLVDTMLGSINHEERIRLLSEEINTLRAERNSERKRREITVVAALAMLALASVEALVILWREMAR